MNVCFTTSDSSPSNRGLEYLLLPVSKGCMEECADLYFLLCYCLYLSADLHPQEQEDGSVILLLG